MREAPGKRSRRAADFPDTVLNAKEARMETAVLCSGLLGLLVFGLGFMVSMTRGKTDPDSGGSFGPRRSLT